jgi:hypothetical protein
MMRIAASMLTEAGVAVCCPVHDALLVECDVDRITEVAAQTVQVMGDASEMVLGSGRRVRVDTDVVAWPDRYVDENAGDMFDQVMRLAQAAEDSGVSARSPL